MKFILFALLVIWQQPLMCPGYPYFPENHHSLAYLSKARLLAKRGCSDLCGEVLIPYPFGVGSNCYYNESYEIICNTSLGPPRPFLKILDLEVMGIALPHELNSLPAVAVRMRPLNVCSRGYASSPPLLGTPYRYSVDENVFIAQGCSGIIVRNKTGDILTKCAPTSCMSNHNTLNNSPFSCDYGNGCCRALVDESITDFDFCNISVSQHSDVVVGSSPGPGHGCNTTVAFIDSSYRPNSYDVHQIGTILRWMAPDPMLLDGDHAHFSCSKEDVSGHRCECNPPYLGNPYLPYGCQVDCNYYGCMVS